MAHATHQRFTRKAGAAFLALVLAVGMMPSAAWAESYVAVPMSDEVTVDASDGILQTGGFNQSAPPAHPGGKLGTLAATADVAKFEAALLKAAEKWDGKASSASVDVSACNISTDEVGSLFQRFINENGQLFHVKSHYSYNYSGTTVRSVTITFDTSLPATALSDFRAEADKALSGVDGSWSDEQKALYLHDYLVTHCEYDKALEKYSAYNALVDHSAVCQGYALAYDYLLSRAGVDSKVITSRIINHAWDLVTVGGNTYYVDCTWDDPSNDWYEAYCAHTNFLRNKEGFAADKSRGGGGHGGTDWIDSSGANVYSNSAIAASDAYESAYWKDVVTVIPNVGSLWAYVHSTWDSQRNVDVLVHDYSTGKDRVLASGIPGTWPAWGNPNSFWQAHYTSLISNGAQFIATSPTSLYSIDTNGDTQNAYTLSDEEKAKGYIYGILYDSRAGTCTYHLRTIAYGSTDAGQGTYDLPYSGKVSLSNVSISLPKRSYTYTGSAISPTPTLSYNNAPLKKDTDYTVTYSNNTNVGTNKAKVTITGKGDYVGTKTVTFSISAASIEKAKVTGLKTKTYNKKAQTQSPTVQLNGKKLNPSTDYTLSYANNTNAGKATVTVKGKGNYTGKVAKTFTIDRAANPMSVKGLAPTVPYSKKATTLSASKAYKFTTAAQGTKSFARASGSSAYLKVNAKTGAITVSAKAPKKKHVVKVAITAKGNSNYKSAKKTVTVTVRVK